MTKVVHAHQLEDVKEGIELGKLKKRLDDLEKRIEKLEEQPTVRLIEGESDERVSSSDS